MVLSFIGESSGRWGELVKVICGDDCVGPNRTCEHGNGIPKMCSSQNKKNARQIGPGGL
jgi:hypothetical protein